MSGLLMLAIVVGAVTALSAWVRGEHVPGGIWLMVAFLASLLFAIVAIWRRTLFEVADLRRLLEGRGGGLDSVSRSALRGHAGELAVVVEPWQDPQRPLSRTAGGASPVLLSSRVQVVRRGDFSALPAASIELNGRVAEAPHDTGDGGLDHALDLAVGELAATDFDLQLEIQPQWLRVAVKGGSWMGSHFGHRITKTLDFAERLLTGLEGRYRGEPPRGRQGDGAPGPFRLLLTVASALGLMLALTAPAAAQPVPAGGAYLASSQQADGSWTSASVRANHATTAATRALQASGLEPAAQAAAVGFLETDSAADTDDRSRRALALAAAGSDVTALVAQIVADADPNGGWGLTGEFTADPLDTSLALIALAAAGQAGSAEAFQGLVSLVGDQNGDGGWPCTVTGDDDDSSEIYCTSHALLALVRFRNLFLLDPQITAAANFLRGRLNPDGSFGPAGPDLMIHSSLAGLALAAVPAFGSEVLTTIAFVEGQQQPDGSWEGDPYTTALALRALPALAAVPFCGDGSVNTTAEACDGPDLAAATCEDLGFGPGILGCGMSCSYDTTGCSPPPVCGDGEVNRPDEACDGADLGGESCASLGFDSGDLACSDVCAFDTSACTVPPECGDGVVNQGSEVCDGADLGGQSCGSLGLGTGDLACSFTCRFDASGCSEPPVCGDGVVNGATERCDGSDLTGLTCESFGGSGGTLACLSNCTNFDVVDCADVPDADMDGFPAGADCDDDDPEVNPAQEEIPLNLKDDDCDLRTPDVLAECSVEVVFTMDTSGSMNDDAAALCSRISQVETDLAALGVDAQTHLLGISQIRGGAYSCLTNHVLSLLGGTVPGDDGACDGFLNQSESWGQATAIVADRFPWTPGAIRVIVPISDEGPCNGNTCFVTGSDRDAIANGAAIAAANETFVSPIVARGANSCVSNLATLAADETGGVVFFSTNPDLDLAGAIADLLIGACEETLGVEITPADAVNPVSTSHPFVATVTDALGFPQEGREVSAEIVSGPNVGELGTATTQSDGGAAFEYTSAGEVGVDEIVASVVDSLGRTVESATALKFWDEDCNENGIADTCDLDCTGFATRCGSVAGCGMSADVNGDAAPDECLLPDAGTDDDDDGFPADVDCDDTDPDVNPGGDEIPGNGTDDDCNPATPDEVSDGAVSCDLTAGQILYDATDIIGLEGAVENSDNLLSLSGLVASVVATDSGGVVVYEETRALAPLPPGARSEQDFDVAAGNAPGDYQAELTISAGGEAVAVCSTDFAISSSADTGAGLTGTLSFDPEVVNAGDPSDVIYTVSNDGNATLTDLGIKVVIVDPDSGEVVGELFDSTSLVEGGVFGADQPFSTAGLAVGDYLGVLIGVLASGDELTLDQALLMVVNVPPDCTGAVADADMLWPPNHKFVDVAINGVVDPDGDPVTLTVTGLLQDEPTMARGDGNTCPDATGLGTAQASVRNERSGKEDGRVYHLFFTADDGRGASCEGEVAVCVPHDQGQGSTCVDQGALFDSTTCP